MLDDETRLRLEPFQASAISDMLAGYPEPTYPEVWFLVPEENGKSTLISALALYKADHRPYAMIPVAAASREQAEIIYRQCEGFVLRTPHLHEMVHSDLQAAKGKKKLEVPRFVCLEGYRRLNHFGGGRIQVFAADDRTGDGLIPTDAIIDEPHRQRDLSLYRTWSGKLNKRSGQIVAISTRGEPGSDFELTLERIKHSSTKVTRKGAWTRYEAPGIVVHEWALADDADPVDFRAVKAANPFSRISITSLRAKYNRPTMTLQHWLRFTCNRPTRSAKAAIEDAEWAGAGDGAIPPGVPIWLGVDAAWKWDTFSMTPLWFRDPRYRVLGPATILVPPRDGSSLDPHDAEEAARAIHRRNPIHTVVMDTSRAEQFAAWLSEEFGVTVIDWPQTNPQAEMDYARFMEALRAGWLKHCADPGLTSHVLNAIAKELPGGGIRFDRPIQSRLADQPRRVIDALAAGAMANSAAAEPAEQVATPGFLGYAFELAGAMPQPDEPDEPDVAQLCAIRARIGSVIGPCALISGHMGGHQP